MSHSWGGRDHKLAHKTVKQLHGLTCLFMQQKAKWTTEFLQMVSAGLARKLGVWLNMVHFILAMETFFECATKVCGLISNCETLLGKNIKKNWVYCTSKQGMEKTLLENLRWNWCFLFYQKNGAHSKYSGISAIFWGSSDLGQTVSWWWYDFRLT